MARWEIRNGSKFAKKTYINMFLCYVCFCTVFFFIYAFGYFDGLRYRRDGFPTDSGICTEYQKTYLGKGASRVVLRLDDHRLDTHLDECVREDSYDEIRKGDYITVSYMPKHPFFLFRTQDILMSIEKDGTQYLDTSAAVDTYRVNGWFCFGFAILHLLSGVGVLVYQKRTKRR